MTSTGALMKITSTAFADGETIPEEYTRDGADMSPPLMLEDVPEEARSLALIVDDPDAPGQVWVHWLVWGISPEQEEIPEGVPPDDVVDALGAVHQGTNDFGEIGYGGPQPPRGHGPHHYRFTAHAIGETLDLDAGATRDELEAAMEGFVLETARLTGVYER
jgi:Raf kinase inhibitor-like YbhB/YbcL family protein